MRRWILYGVVALINFFMLGLLGACQAEPADNTPELPPEEEPLPDRTPEMVVPFWSSIRVDSFEAKPGSPFRAEIAFGTAWQDSVRFDMTADTEELEIGLPGPYIVDGITYKTTDFLVPLSFDGSEGHDAFPQRFTVTLAPSGTKEFYASSVEILILQTCEYSGAGGSHTLYYCGTNERLCFSLESAEDAAMKYENTR